MTDNTELKRLADELIPANDLFNESPQDNEVGDVWSLANDRFTEAASPEAILALIAENDRLNTECKQLILLEHNGGSVEAATNLLAERDQLKAENEALRQSVAEHKACIASDNELFREVNLECNRYHSVIVAVGQLLGISKEEQDEEEATQEELVEAINELWGQVHGMQEDPDEYKSEHEVLRQVLVSSHEFILNDARTRRMCDETGQVSPLFPKRVGILAAIDAALGQGEQS